LEYSDTIPHNYRNGKIGIPHSITNIDFKMAEASRIKTPPTKVTDFQYVYYPFEFSTSDKF